MSKEKTKVTFQEATQAWINKHRDEGLDLKGLNAALAAVEKSTVAAQAAANKLGEALATRKAALKELKSTLKVAKAERKAPKKPVAKAAPKPVAKKAVPSKAPKPTTPS